MGAIIGKWMFKAEVYQCIPPVVVALDVDGASSLVVGVAGDGGRKVFVAVLCTPAREILHTYISVCGVDGDKVVFGCRGISQGAEDFGACS